MIVVIEAYTQNVCEYTYVTRVCGVCMCVSELSVMC